MQILYQESTDMIQYKYFSIEKTARSTSGKTNIYTVTKPNGVILGQVKWYGAWRCYTLHPSNETIWNAGCLHDIEIFCANATAAQRMGEEVISDPPQYKQEY